MSVQVLHAKAHEAAVAGEAAPGGAAWTWVDAHVEGDAAEVLRWGEVLGIDPLLLRDAIEDSDIPKVDDLGDHLQLTIHGPAIDDLGRFASKELDCVLVEGSLLTIRHVSMGGLDWLLDRVQERSETGAEGADMLLAVLVDVTCRRFGPVVEGLDRLADEQALAALTGSDVLAEVVSLRRSESQMRRVLVPMRDAVDQLARVGHGLIGDAARRRLRDTVDLCDRLVGLLDSGRAVLSDALAIQQGLAAQRMARATKVFTIYAAVMLPLTFVTGFFGMNFVDLPGLGSGGGWVVAGGIMAVSALVSVWVFWRTGLLTPERPETPRTTDLLREAVTTPVRLVAAIVPVRRAPRDGS